MKTDYENAFENGEECERQKWIAKVKGMIEEIEIKIKNDNLIYPPDKGLTISERFELTGAKKKLSKLLEK